MMFAEAEDALKNGNVKVAQAMLEREEHINKLQNDFKQTHVNRLNEGSCQLNSGFIFIEFIDNLET